MRPLRLQLRLYIYLAVVVAAGSIVMVVTIPKARAAIPYDSPAFWLFAFCVVVGELVPIKVPRRTEAVAVTVSGTFAFAVLITSGPTAALLTLAAASIVDDLLHLKPIWKTAFNVSQYALSITFAGLVLTSLSDLPTSRPALSAGDLPVILLAGVGFFVVNWALTCSALAFAEGMSVIASFRASLGLQTVTDCVLLALSPIVVAISEHTLFLVPLLILPVMVVYKFARLSLQNLELVEKLRQANKHLSLHDGLSGLPNRTLFQERVEQAIALANRDSASVAVMLIDIDRFREVNDALGHHNGDQLLKSVGVRLRESLRQSDTIARLGGDEFGVLLPSVPHASGAIKAAETVLRSLETPFTLQELSLQMGASIGIAMYPEHGSDSQALMRRADIAMYGAKDVPLGFQVYDSGVDEHTRDRLAMVEQLRLAIERGEFVLHYQPKVNLRTGRIAGVEALLRWYNPEHGQVRPDVFIPLAEHTGLIRPLTLHVIDVAIRQCREWRKVGIDLGVAVNLSVHNLLDPELPSQIAKVLSRWEVLPSYLELEITESSIVADPVRVGAVLDELSSMGVGLSIDDFGTGYSSLSRLRRLPVDELKIDKSFVMNMSVDADDAVIVRSTIELGRNLGLRVVAEGVEKESVAEDLMALGCDVAQGYYLSRPIPSDELMTWHRDFDISTYLSKAPLSQPVAVR